MNRLWLAMIASFTISAANPSPVQTFRLPNGLLVRLSEDHECPLVRLEFRATWDAAEIPSGREGMVGFLGHMLEASGAGGMDREAFLRSLEEKALRSSFHWTSGAYTWSMLAASQNIDPAFHFLALAVMRPDFSDVSIEHQQQVLLHKIEARSPREQAEARFLRSVGDSTILASPEAPLLPSIQFLDLDRFRRRVLRPERAALAIRGDLNLDQARALVALHFGAWAPGAEPPLSPIAISPAKEEARTWLIGDSDAPLEIWVGCPLGQSPQRTAQELATRLFQRELASEPVSEWGTVTLRAVPGALGVVQATLRPGIPTEVGLKNFQALLAHLRGRIWTDFDLAWARRTWQAERLADVLHPRRIAEALAVTQEPTSLAAAQPQSTEDIQKIFKEWLEPSSLRWLILGAKPGDSTLLDN